MFNGIRHLAWDFGYGYEIKTANLSGIIVLLLSILTTFFIWII
jgi:succinate dehydrogenase / fumarate reductase cytochrome b subunit